MCRDEINVLRALPSGLASQPQQQASTPQCSLPLGSGVIPCMRACGLWVSGRVTVSGKQLLQQRGRTGGGVYRLQRGWGNGFWSALAHVPYRVGGGL